jgi:hypothetical protein
MNAISFANRLIRDLKVKNIQELTADARLEILDAINGSIQRLHDRASDHSKTGVVSLSLDAPVTVSIGVTNGSRNVTVYAFPSDTINRSIRISGDNIDNQISGTTTLTHPYKGTSGTVSATIYCDAISIPEPFAEVVTAPIILETGERLTDCHTNLWLQGTKKNITQPISYWLEPNAANLNSTAPIVMRFGSYPDKVYRLQAEMITAPLRIEFADLLTHHVKLPIRAEHVESYLLPIARACLTDSALWEKSETSASVDKKGDKAMAEYMLLVPQYAGTPRNRFRTKRGY